MKRYYTSVVVTVLASMVLSLAGCRKDPAEEKRAHALAVEKAYAEMGLSAVTDLELLYARTDGDPLDLATESALLRRTQEVVNQLCGSARTANDAQAVVDRVVDFRKGPWFYDHVELGRCMDAKNELERKELYTELRLAKANDLRQLDSWISEADVGSPLWSVLEQRAAEVMDSRCMGATTYEELLLIRKEMDDLLWLPRSSTCLTQGIKLKQATLKQEITRSLE